MCKTGSRTSRIYGILWPCNCRCRLGSFVALRSMPSEFSRMQSQYWIEMPVELLCFEAALRERQIVGMADCMFGILEQQLATSKTHQTRLSHLFSRGPASSHHIMNIVDQIQSKTWSGGWDCVPMSKQEFSVFDSFPCFVIFVFPMTDLLHFFMIKPQEL